MQGGSVRNIRSLSFGQVESITFKQGRIIAVDRYANVPAIQLAHRSWAIDMRAGKAREEVTAIRALEIFD